MLTTVAAFREPWEAHLFRLRLEAEGIPAFVIHEYHVGNMWSLSTALGGARIQVCDGQEADARSIAHRCARGEFRDLLDEEFGAAEAITCPVCGSREHWRRRPTPRSAMAIALSFVTHTVIPPVGWVYICDACGTKFRQPLCPLSAARVATMFAAMGCALVPILGLALCAWALGTRYWFVVPIAAIFFAGYLAARSELGNSQS